MRVSEGVKLEAPCLVAGGAGAGGGGDPKRPARLVAASCHGLARVLVNREASKYRWTMVGG